MLFDVLIDSKAVPCSISRSAILEIAEHCSEVCFSLPSYFNRNRGLIENIARRKYAEQTSRLPGRLHLWADDVVEPPPGGSPTTAAQIACADVRGVKAVGVRFA
ncbi:DUF1488 family protein [Teichococcus deserti]|uniref:DUF1488 family protein n=1 Tax=Teichococcus deserti TaxID=1817963 RepID=UPI000978BAE3|nr:DUF1488 family protein [Pseudoroseomonas deserti]